MASDYSSERGNPTVAACQTPVGLHDVSLTFTGDQLHLRGGGALRSYPAKSGGTSANYASIPKGRYWVQPAELWSRGLLTNTALCISAAASSKTCHEMIDGHTAAWGDYRLTIHPYPGTNVGDRGGFFIHGGAAFGSKGCIDLAGGMNRFVEDLGSLLGSRRANCYIDLEVT
jgi:hypothetical protein